MTIKQLVETNKGGGKIRHGATPMDWFILILVLALIAGFNATAMQDRLLLFLYAMGVAGAAFVMLKRGALVFTAITLAAASTLLLVNVYCQTSTESWYPTLDAVRDIVGLSVIAFVVARLLQEIHRVQQAARMAIESRIGKQVEVNTVT